MYIFWTCLNPLLFIKKLLIICCVFQCCPNIFCAKIEIFCADLVELALLLQRPPVLVGHAEPLAVPGPDVDVDRREVVVLLMTRRPRSGNLKKYFFWDKIFLNDKVSIYNSSYLDFSSTILPSKMIAEWEYWIRCALLSKLDANIIISRSRRNINLYSEAGPSVMKTI